MRRYGRTFGLVMDRFKRPKLSLIMKEIRRGMGVDADRWNPRLFGRSKRISFRACPAITFVHKEGRICRRVDVDLGFTGRVQAMDQKEAVGKLTKRVDNPRIDRRSSW